MLDAGAAKKRAARGDVSTVRPGDTPPIAVMSPQSRDTCQVRAGPKCGMMVPLAFRYERKSFLFALVVGLHEGV